MLMLQFKEAHTSHGALRPAAGCHAVQPCKQPTRQASASHLLVQATSMVGGGGCSISNVHRDQVVAAAAARS